MIAFPNAKINIGLNITKKRADGFHNIETLFYPVKWRDALEIIPSEEFNFSTRGISIPGDSQNNLCVKAYNSLKNDFKIDPVSIILLKNIPMGAGLGGGSSDATFTLKMLNEYFELKLNEEHLIQYARKIGSDCAFFIKNKPVYAFEKGDVFEDVFLDLSEHQILVIYPEVNVSTKEAYDGVIPVKPNTSLRDIIKLPITEWKNKIVNDFEKTIFQKYSQLQLLKEMLYKEGAIYASMSGSGSSIFGIFNKSTNLQKTADQMHLNKQNYFIETHEAQF